MASADAAAVVDALFDDEGVIAAWFDTDLRFVRASEAFGRTVGRAVDGLVGQRHTEVLVAPEALALFDRAAAPGGPRVGVVRRVAHPSSTDLSATRWDCHLTRLADADGAATGYLLRLTDATDAVRLEQKAEEWRLVIRELNHRVKNNLQVVSAFVREVGYEHPAAQPLVDRALGRVASIARMHEMLANAKSHCSIDVGEYARAIADEVRQIHGRPEVTVRVSGTASAPIDVAGHVGMILQELLSNAYEHGFPRGRGGAISVELGAGDGGCMILVRDDGIGLATDPGPSDASGLELVTGLCEQLGGRFEARAASPTGTICSVRVPIADKRR